MMDLLEGSTSQTQFVKRYQFNRSKQYGAMSNLVRFDCRQSVKVEGLSMTEMGKRKCQDLQSLQTGFLVWH